MIPIWRYPLMVLLVTLVVQEGSAQSRRHRHSSSTHHSQSPNELKKDLNDLKNKKAELQSQLKATKREKDAVLADIFSVDKKLNQIEDQLEQTTGRLSDSRAEQIRLAKELKVTTSKLEETRAQVAQRLRHMYVHGDASAVSALVGTKTVGDVASRRFLMQMIAKKDRQLFTDYQNLRDLVANRKKRQDQLVARIRDLAHQQEAQQNELQDTRDEKGQVLKGLRNKQGKIQQMLAQYEADERELRAEIAAYARRKLKPGEKLLPAFHGRFMHPVDGPIISSYGMRYHPVLHYTRMHRGIDFGVPTGTSIHAAADGRVITAHYSTSFGNVIMIDHGGGITTVYAHCSRLLVGDGDAVHRGQTIARSGATGLASGPHLHWEVHVNNHDVNPRSWL